ncbi:hypothetical protein G9A89_006488 [Geosiphon pyriformis]|nr:hypothetical protein G9A89_006488 [Geosiphon pyriformis]
MGNCNERSVRANLSLFASPFKMDNRIIYTLSKSQLFVRTVIKHYYEGPPQPSWDLRFHLSFMFMKSFFSDIIEKTIEEAQILTSVPPPTPSNVCINPVIIPNTYRDKAKVPLDKILKPYEQVLDESWKAYYDDNGIESEWIYMKDDEFFNQEKRQSVILYLHGGGYYLCSSQLVRGCTYRLAQASGSRVLAVNYRLAPQHEFPAALHDAMAAYMYLLDPPEDSDYQAFHPSQIVIAGDSAGGGLSLAMVLVLRDAGLPMPAGVIGFSPWVDLTHSMPSIVSEDFDETDYIPRTIFSHPPSPLLEKYEQRAKAFSAKVKNFKLSYVIEESLKREERIQLYAPNEALAIPYVSPLLAESLGGLPPMLLQAGDGERLRDEIIYFSFKASNPAKYQFPEYATRDFERSPFQTPTKTILEVYDDMCHVWQLFSTRPTQISMERVAAFIQRLTSINNAISQLPSSSSLTTARILPTGEEKPLLKHHLDVLDWKYVGILPNISHLKIESKSQNITQNYFSYFVIILLCVTILYMAISLSY